MLKKYSGKEHGSTGFIYLCWLHHFNLSFNIKLLSTNMNLANIKIYKSKQLPKLVITVQTRHLESTLYFFFCESWAELLCLLFRDT